MPTHEEHEILLTRWFEELWNKKNYEVAQKLLHSDFVDHANGNQAGQGVAGVVETVRSWHSGFPDGRMTLEDVYTDGDKAVVRTTFRGTHNGPFGGVAPSGKKVTVTSIGIERIADGKIAESWGDLNLLGVMQQIGAIPSPEQ
ncbi:MAG: ester cyclase [Anaerolineales bacterium]|nr:ester cyclase [Anaerolineales bacterium]